MARKKAEKMFDMEAIENSKVIDVELNNEMKKSYIDYAMSVIVSRALPDVRDGMKPVHRRILYDMYESNLLYEADFRKSAATVGDVLGKYHPHGDSSVYMAMVRLAQDFSLRYPLVQGKGNFGSIDGDPPAAYRYTEAKMSKIAAHMLSDIEKETVDFVSNYDDKLKEPSVLPSRFPNLLVNGSSGIAVGMATNIPPHNLCEVVDGIVAVIDDPYITLDELMTHIQGPDFPTGGLIMGRSGIRKAYSTGRGRVIMRAKAEIEEYNGRSRIVVTELPYQVNKAKLETQINELARDGRIEGISSTRDESDTNINLIIELKKDANANVVLNNLYKLTPMQETFGVIFVALVDGQPKCLNLREMIDAYITHQEDVIRRRVQFDLKKAKEHAHLLEGYKVAIDYIDEVISIIRSSQSIADSKANLIERFGLSEVQATAIVQMQLGRLSGLERNKIEEDYAETMAKIEEYTAILGDEAKVLEIVKNDLITMKDKFGDERRSEITMVTDEIEDEDLIEEEDVVLTMSHNGYIKRVPVDTYRSQHRGGRGIFGMSTREEDYVENMFSTSTHDHIMFFTTRGVVYRLKGYQIPEAGRTAKGTAIVNLLPLEADEKVTAIIPIREFTSYKDLVFITRKGVVKKTCLTDYSKIRKVGLRAINLDEDDVLIDVLVSEADNDIMLTTHNGMAIRFKENDVRGVGRTARGVRGIRLKGDDYVVGGAVITDDAKCLVVTEKGYGKKTDFAEYKAQSRGGMGVKTYKITDKTGALVGMTGVTDENDMLLITSDGVVIRMHANEISTIGRNTQGVRLMRLADDVAVVGMAITGYDDGEKTETPDNEARAEPEDDTEQDIQEDVSSETESEE